LEIIWRSLESLAGKGFVADNQIGPKECQPNSVVQLLQHFRPEGNCRAATWFVAIIAEMGTVDCVSCA
jgi:hypothetical protein